MKLLAPILAALVTLLLAAPVAAADPPADSGFGDRGEVRVPLANGGNSVAFDLLELPNGEAIVAGRVLRSEVGPSDGAFVARLRADGTLDPGFGEGGLILDLARSAARGTATSLTLDSAGRVLAAGLTSGRRGAVFVARFDEAGLDPSFGEGGIFEVPSENANEVTTGDGIEVRPDGRIVVAVRTRRPDSGGHRPGVVQLLPDGGLDLSFSADGRRTLGNALLDPLDDRGFDECTGCDEGDIALDARGGVLIVGRKGNGINLIRLSPSGRLDRDFGERGRARLQPSRGGGKRRDLSGGSVVVRDNGGIVIAGAMISYLARGGRNQRDGFIFAGLDAEGGPDQRFARGRIRALRLDGDLALALDLVETPQGGFAAAGYISTPRQDLRWALAAVDRRGRPDRAAMPKGGVLDFPRYGQANALDFDSEGRPVLAGFGSSKQVATLARLDPAG